MKKIKILHVGMSSNLGGIEKYLINIYRNIDHNLFQLDYLAFKGEKICFLDELLKKSNVYYTTSRKKNYIQYLNDLKEFFRTSNYDYIHFHLMEFSCFERILYAKKYTNSKIILHSHIANHKISSIKTKILNKIGELKIKKEDIYLKVACSKNAGEYMFKKFKYKTFDVFNNGINVDEFKFSKINRLMLRKKLKIENKFVVGNIGRLVKQKNHKFLLEIFKEILKIKNDSVLLLIGKGKLKEKLMKKANRLNIQDNIVYIENTDKINEYMSAMDAFVLPSLFEGLPIVLIEAQASGLKCFITNTLSNEVDMSENIFRISLSNSADFWAQNIIKEEYMCIEDRIKTNEEIKNSDFDIIKSVKKLEKYYKEKIGDIIIE